MSDRPVKIVKKKVAPYPFRATIEANGVKRDVEIIYLSSVGLIVRLKMADILSVGEYYVVTFEIPVRHDLVTANTRVWKTYDKTIDFKEKKIERLAELQFEDLTKEQRTRITAFARAIGQDK